jgi:hypothetical protein
MMSRSANTLLACLISGALLGCDWVRSLSEKSEGAGSQAEQAEDAQLELFGVLYGNVVISKGGDPLARGVRPLGARRVVSRRDDRDESFVAEVSVDVGSLPLPARDLIAADYAMFGGSPDKCVASGKEAEPALLAWAAPLTSTWDELPDEELANEIFRVGNTFLVSKRQACLSAEWATSPNNSVKVERATLGATLPHEEAKQHLAQLPYSGAWQAKFAEFAAAENMQHSDVKTWIDLPGDMQRWIFADSDVAQLTATCFERRATPELVGRFNEAGRPWFHVDGLAVWGRSAGLGELLGPVVPAFDPELVCISFGTVRVGGNAPMITFVTDSGTGVLRNQRGKYVVVDALTLSPGR